MTPSFEVTKIERVGNSGYAITVAAKDEDGAEMWRLPFSVRTKGEQGITEALKQAAKVWADQNPTVMTALGDKIVDTIQGWIDAGMAKAQGLFKGTKK